MRTYMIWDLTWMGAKRSASDRPTEMEKARRPMFQQELEELKGGGPPDKTAVAEFK